MRIRKILTIFFLATSLYNLSCKSSKDSGPAPIQAVYIDPSSSIGGDGTYSKPYKYWGDITFQTGKTYLQKRGTIAREQITVNVSNITLSDYGSGDLPVIQGSEMQGSWLLESGFVFKKTISTPSGGLGMVAEDGIPLKFLEWKTDFSTTFAGASAGSFSFNPSTNTLYVWCSNNADPTTHTMEVSQRYFGIHGNNVSDVQIKNINVRYVSLHGIHFENSSNISIENCVIEKLGGTVISLVPLIYAGNGIEFGGSSSNSIVKNTTITEIFDSGVSPQTYQSNKIISNINFDTLTISKCGFAGLEIAALYNGGMVNSSIQNVTAKNLTITNNGKGWSGRRYGSEGRGIKIAADINGADISRFLSGILIENCLVQGNKGDGVFIGGRSGSVILRQTTVKNNEQSGIVVQEAGNSDITLNLSSSVIDSNSSYGVIFNVPTGNGFKILNNTFSNNGNVALIILNQSGLSEIINNLFYSASYITAFFYSNGILSAPVIDNNFFTQFGANLIIGYNGSTYSDALAFNTGQSSIANANLGGDPLINSDLTLQNLSPCKYIGKTGTAISVDRNNNAYHNPPSIGAFEY